MIQKDNTTLKGRRVFVTGASGFIGSNLTKHLISEGAEIIALVEPGADMKNLQDLEIEIFVGDVRDRDAVQSAMSGCQYVFHVAALYRFMRNHTKFYQVNVEGSKNVIKTALSMGVKRIVYTSTVGTLGLVGSSFHAPKNEDSYARIEHLFGAYKRSKYVAEHEILRLCAKGAPVVIVQPTMPIGPGDIGITPTGQTVLDFLNGRYNGYVNTSFNIVDVRDVARGHVLALTRGVVGESYILGGQNVSMKILLNELANISGLEFSQKKVPLTFALAIAYVSDFLFGKLLGKESPIPLEGALMATTQMVFDDSKARRELGYKSRPFREALIAATEFFVKNDMVREDRKLTILQNLNLIKAA